MGAGCTTAEHHRAGAIRRQRANDRNSINIDPIMATPPLADSWEQTSDHSVEQSRRMSNPSLPSPMKPCRSSQAASAQVPIIVNPELARCSKRSPSLAGASSVAYPAWGEEVSKKPPGLRQAKCLQRAPPARGAECRCELRALLAGRGSAAAAAAALQALPDFCPNRLRFLLALRGIAGAADLLPAWRSAFALQLAAGAPRC